MTSSVPQMTLATTFVSNPVLAIYLHLHCAIAFYGMTTLPLIVLNYMYKFLLVSCTKLTCRLIPTVGLNLSMHNTDYILDGRQNSPNYYSCDKTTKPFKIINYNP